MAASEDADSVLAEQIEYYRRRAAEYDATAYPRFDASRDRIERVVAELAPTGRVLELACGTGMWTRALAAHCTELTAVDASSETISIARGRAPAHVRFEVADLFTWRPAQTYDVVFFAFWLSHVPSARVAEFLEWVTAAAPDGRVLFVDEHAGAPSSEMWADRPEIAIREMTDGSQHRMVKVFLDAGRLREQFARLGWSVEFALNGAWLIGSAHR
jgi:trans-aconitate methyltransferase